MYSDEIHLEVASALERGDFEEVSYVGPDTDPSSYPGLLYHSDSPCENLHPLVGLLEVMGSVEIVEMEYDGECSERDGVGSSGRDSNGNLAADGDNLNRNNDNAGNVSGDTKVPADIHMVTSVSIVGMFGHTRTLLGNYDTTCTCDIPIIDETKSVPIPSSITFGRLPTHHGDETGTCHTYGSKLKEGGHECIGLCILT